MCPTDTSPALLPKSDAVERQNAHLLSLRHLDPFSMKFVPIPAGEAVCRVHAIRGGVMDASLGIFEHGSKEGERVPYGIDFFFLIEKLWNDGREPTRMLFDLGLRAGGFDKPAYKYIEKTWTIDPGRGAAKILESMNIPVESIRAIILGHNHFDHVGDLRTFPPTADLIVGPGTTDLAGLANEMDVPLKTLEERTVKYLSRERDKWKDVGTFRGHDYFGDGSLFILDAPGHVPGHLAALVRTSSSPPIYHLLASDTAHQITLLRSPKNPSTTRKRYAAYPKFGAEERDGVVPLDSMHNNLEEAYRTIAKAERMDLEDNVNVFLAHDWTMDITLGGNGGPGAGPRARVLAKKEYVTLEGTKEELDRFKSRDWQHMKYEVYSTALQ
ncbi:beta-lactamase-like protein [Cantharellus anzutake]|uniref:beta-lactamase-like protein n=1 Tax=Cantharellus anzutake TaxID=1750568 RepID=UPI00190885B8|nr:beta-lactamase-like protein [Cantharellus anzutake]KAF8333138.1 beta-lactamase-like protein [Cantharellus anzutake]